MGGDGGGEGHSQNVRPRPDLCKLGETNQPFHFGNVHHPHQCAFTLTQHKTPSKMGGVEAFKIHIRIIAPH